VRPQDVSAYTELQRRVDDGKSLGVTELDRLSSLFRTSPGLIGAYVLAAGIARGQGDTERAIEYVKQAESLAPYDPRPLIAHFRAELEDDRLDAALATLARLENLLPGDVRVKTARADLLEKQGRLQEALSLREEIARRRPTWRYILKLAKLEFLMGAGGSARQHLEAILAENPDNQYAWESLAAVELAFGDLKRAAMIYGRLIRTDPSPDLTANLGLTYFILGEYDAAAVAYRKALARDPDDRKTRFNLATTLEAQGDLAGARKLYRTLAAEVATHPPPLDGYTQMLHAQCLARLGQKEAAARLADEALQQRPEDVQMLHQAAQIYAIVGDSVQALFYIQLALEKGLSREWFTVPGLRSLQDDPKLRELLDKHGRL
jgi:tetratricopeptide (TPR) repeat protein